jgi:hypothetical protein
MLVLDPFLEVRARGDTLLLPQEVEEKFERGVTLCACLAWHFYEISSEMEFRTADLATGMFPAGEIIYDVLRHLAFVQPRPAETGRDFLSRLTQETQIFKIILTSQPRGSIPTSLWTSSYFLFLQSLGQAL